MKRLFDLLVSVVVLIIVSPVVLILSFKIAKNLGRPIFFRQVRPGLNGKTFHIVKFRSMCDAVDDSGNPLSDAERLTPFGRWLRSVSLDELPELWNVLKGEMSLVGPRPLLMEYMPLYTTEQMRRHEVRPGITGWAQVNGRNTLSWEKKFNLDLWYVENHSLWLDMKILVLTVRKVFCREGISAQGNATMPKFTGSRGGENQ